MTNNQTLKEFRKEERRIKDLILEQLQENFIKQLLELVEEFEETRVNGMTDGLCNFKEFLKNISTKTL